MAFCALPLTARNEIIRTSVNLFSTLAARNTATRCLAQPTPHTHPFLMKEDEVTPGLTKANYKGRRQNLAEMLCTEKLRTRESQTTEKHVLIVLGAPVTYMTQDIPYQFHQNTNFSYLTGFQEPDACLVLETVPRNDDRNHIATLFVQKRDPVKELWNGARAGTEGAVEHTGVDDADEIHNLGEVLKRYQSHDYTIWYDYDRMTNLQLHLSQVRAFLQEAHKMGVNIRQAEAPIHEQRHIKSPEECKLMATSCDIVSEAIIDAMSMSCPGINESEINARLEYVVKTKGAQMLAFPPVVAGGNRANTLHYVINNQRIKDGSMVLVDAGAHCHGYVSDVTRTWPINGKFSAPQQELYEAVLRVQELCINLCTPGQSLDQIYNTMSMTLAKELVDMGVLKEKYKISELMQIMQNFCPHHVGHWLGMDVHDTPEIKRSLKLLPGMVITIEPGLYIREDNQYVEEKYRGVGIRIEDDVLITNEEPVVLSLNCPKTVEDIEKIMRK